MVSPYLGEVFVDAATGEWLGDFHDGDGPMGPFGWCRCLGTSESCEANRIGRYFNIPPCCSGSPHFLRTVYLPVPFAYGVQSMRTIADDVAPAAWSSSDSYVVGDLVPYSGQIYISVWDVDPGLNLNQQPDISPDYWQPFDPTLTGSPSAASCMVELPGTNNGAGFGWAGEQMEVADAWLQAGALTGDTGWHPLSGECWKYSCWAKAIDVGLGSDSVKRWLGDTYPSPDAGLQLAFSLPGQSDTPIQDFALTMGDWVFCEASFNWPFSDTGPGHSKPWAYPLVKFTGNQLDQPIDVTETFLGNEYTHTVRQRLGHVLVRDLHLYRCDQNQGNWIDSFHGHG